MSSILVIGGTGILGSELGRLDSRIILLNSEYDIYDFKKLEKKINDVNPDIIINCASIKSENVSENPIISININLIGACNISKHCIVNKRRLVYISTDYVYSGEKGNYKETDGINPVNDYAWTKLGAESSTRLVKDHLIIRTSFGSSNFPYKEAWDNQIVSKDYVDVIAPKILKASTSKVTGIINIGTNPKTMYEYAMRRNIVKKGKIKTSKNFSLNTEKYEELFNN